jgi:hypothetical protein
VTTEQGIMILYAIAQIGGTGHLLWRLKIIEEKMGNGRPGIFARRDVLEQKHEGLDRRISALENAKPKEE